MCAVILASKAIFNILIINRDEKLAFSEGGDNEGKYVSEKEPELEPEPKKSLKEKTISATDKYFKNQYISYRFNFFI